MSSHRNLLLHARPAQYGALRTLGGAHFRVDAGKGRRVRFVGGNPDLLPAALLRAPRDWRSWVHPDDRAVLEEALAQVRLQQQPSTREFRLTRTPPDGRVQWLRVTATPAGPDGQRWIDCYAEDVTEAHESRARLLMLSRVADQISDAVVVADASGDILYTNTAFEAMTGWRSREVQHSNLAELPEGTGMSTADIELARNLAPGAKIRDQQRARRRSNATYEQQRTLAAMHDGAGRFTGVIITSADVTEQVRYRQELEYLKHHDPLTSAANRSGLEHYLATRPPDRERVVALAVINPEYFGEVNDTYGYAAGDRVLIEMAERLAAAVSANDLVARLPGGHFAVAVELPAGGAGVAAIAEGLLHAVQRTYWLSAQEPLYLQARIGATWSALPVTRTAELIAEAHCALNRAQAQPEHRIAYFERSATAISAPSRIKLLTALSDAVHRRAFRLAYQPQFELASGTLTGVEALLRWERDGADQPRDVFLPILEETGLIVAAGRWAIHEAMRTWKAWHDAGYAPERLGINLSAMEVRDPGLVPYVRQCLRDSGVPARALVFEITESVFLSNMDAHIQTLHQLRQLGVSLALDDFGTGYSSLSYLKHFPVQALKIDKSFVRDVTSDPGAAAITRAIITMAHAMELDVIAEGVETKAQVGFLRQHGCNKLQGFHYDRPLEGEEIVTTLRDRRSRTIPALTSESCVGTLLIVDDEAAVRHALRRLFRHHGYRLLFADRADEALDLLALNKVDVILADQRMPGTSGTELLSAVRHMYPHTVRMILSGYTDVTTITEAVNSGAIYKFISKPWENDELCRYVEDAFQRNLANESPGGP